MTDLPQSIGDFGAREEKRATVQQLRTRMARLPGTK